MKKSFLTLICLFVIVSVSIADEGMWLPSLIGKMRYDDMKAKGFKLTAKDLYDVNNASLKDAIVRFGNGCTAEIISDNGLLITNHHCGYGQIQSHSSVENDYLTNGFWAKNNSEELPNAGLTVSRLVRMVDVTKQSLKGVSDKMNEAERKKIIANNNAIIISKAVENNHYSASIEPFYYGNQYFMFVYEVFRDIRLVGAPASSIGKFGGDTDNWMWPRHTGDFSIFRIYTDKDNKPADYSAENVPYEPKKSFVISLDGAAEGDFTFVYGFPGRTYEYLTSDAVDYLVNMGNPHKINLRTIRLNIMNDEQAKDVATRIKYASKKAGVANAWKKWQGELKGVVRMNVVDIKRKQEAEFSKWAASKPKYANVLDSLSHNYRKLSGYAFARDYYTETYNAIEITKFADLFSKTTQLDDAKIAQLRTESDNFFKNYSAFIDKRIAAEMLFEYAKNISKEFWNT